MTALGRLTAPIVTRASTAVIGAPSWDQPQLHHDRVLPGAVVAAADAQLAEAEPHVQRPRRAVAGPDLEEDHPGAALAALAGDGVDQDAADAEPPPLRVHRDVQEVH